METKFQTSFIPKKPVASTIGATYPSSQHHANSLFMTLATLIFIVSLVGAGGVYAYKQYLINNQDVLKQELATREKQFNVDLISQLKAENVKIDMAHSLIKNHVALSQIFDLIGRLTIANVRFMSLDATVPAVGSSDNGIKISLQGYGTSLSAVAFQSDILGQLDQYGLRNIIKNPILSNPALGGNGAISFGFTATVDPGSLSYENMVSPSATSGVTGTSTTTN